MWSLPDRGRHRRIVRIVASALYCLVLTVASFEHHDFLCHLQHPQHCTACTASPLGCDPETLAVPRTFALADAGRAITVHLTVEGALLPVRSTGRSPPLHI
jgi:hypothetical protein